MNFAELTFIAVALAMDAFAVSVACGISAPKIPLKNAVTIACAFGLFQAGMPIIGWNISAIGYDIVKDFDHWVAFFILLGIGGKMIYDALKSGDDNNSKTNFANPLKLKTLAILAVATSLDALAIGVSFKCLNRAIIFPSIYIGIITFLFCVLGVKFANKIGNSHDSKFTFAGGAVLVFIGIKILISG